MIDENAFEKELNSKFSANEADIARFEKDLATIGGEIKRMVVSLNNMTTAVSNAEIEISRHIDEIRGWIDTWKTKDDYPGSGNA